MQKNNYKEKVNRKKVLVVSGLFATFLFIGLLSFIITVSVVKNVNSSEATKSFEDTNVVSQMSVNDKPSNSGENTSYIGFLDLKLNNSGYYSEEKIQNPNEYYSLTANHSHSWSGWQHNSEIHWKVCKTCGEYKSAEYHQLYEYKRVNATCYKNGYVKYKCKCGYKCKKILKASKAHVYGNGVVIKKATCCEQGIKQYTCKNCGKVKKKYIAPNGNHSYDSGVITVAPTCSTNGVKTFTCRSCGNRFNQSISATGNHVYGTPVVYRQPTCTEEGINAYTCIYCNNVYYQKTSKSQHLYDSGTVTVTPTCTKDGIKTYTCYYCGTKKNEVIKSSASHTCKYWSCNDTYHFKQCTSCGTVYDTEYHKFDSGRITVQPTQDATGIRTYRCNTCGYEKTEVIPKLQIASASGKLEVLLSQGNYYAGQTITFTLRYSNVSYPENVKIYIDGYEIPQSQVSVAYQGTGFITYNVDASWVSKGNRTLQISATNCSTTYVTLNMQ